MNGLRLEFQDRVNFVILDLDLGADRVLARSIGLAGHPNFGALAPNSNEVVQGLYSAPRSGELRAMIEALLEEHGG